jgi:hypothetical protein
MMNLKWQSPRANGRGVLGQPGMLCFFFFPKCLKDMYMKYGKILILC